MRPFPRSDSSAAKNTTTRSGDIRDGVVYVSGMAEGALAGRAHGATDVFVVPLDARDLSDDRRWSGTSGTNDDSCAIVAPAQSGAAWMLLLPAAALLWRRWGAR